MKKKERSQLFVSIVSIICVFLSGFCIWHYWSSQPGADEGDLTITITYPDYDINRITPLPEMECAADKNFSNMLHQISNSFDPDRGGHEYHYQVDSIPKTLYIKAPDLYLLLQPYSAEVPCTIGNVANYNGAPWFTVRSISSEKISAGVFDIKVTIDAFQDVVPSLTSLKIDGVTLNEIRSDPDKIFKFDNYHYATETLLFRYNRHARDDISDILPQAVLQIEDISYRISDDKITASCNIPDVNIVIVPTDTAP